jgi:hypothetical protein
MNEKMSPTDQKLLLEALALLVSLALNILQHNNNTVPCMHMHIVLAAHPVSFT